jgi:hypothetical protein
MDSMAMHKKRGAFALDWREVKVGVIRGKIRKTAGMTLMRIVEMHQSWDVLIASAYQLIGGSLRATIHTEWWG